MLTLKHEKNAKKVLSSYHKSLFGEKDVKQKLELIWQHSSGLKDENLAKFVFQLFHYINQFIFQFFNHPTKVNLDQYPHSSRMFTIRSYFQNL